MLVALTPWFFALAGLLMFALSKGPNANSDVKKLGEIMFLAGLFVGLFTLPALAARF